MSFQSPLYDGYAPAYSPPVYAPSYSPSPAYAPAAYPQYPPAAYSAPYPTYAPAAAPYSAPYTPPARHVPYTPAPQHHDPQYDTPFQGVEVVVGPVIGTVTAQTARVLIEINATQAVTMSLSDGRGSVVKQTEYMTKGIPQIFRFSGLRPLSKYTVTVHGVRHCRSGFKTFSVRPTIADGLKFGIISCNKYRHTKLNVAPHDDVWAALMSNIDHDEIDMALHLGDQVYADDDYEASTQGKVTKEKAMQYCTFLQAMELLAQTPKSSWEHVRLKIIEMYRDEYRKTWGHPATRLALANVPNIMQYDDHEIRDDLGDKPEEFDPNSDVYFIAECGRRAVFEYQRILHEDVDLSHPTQVGPVFRENHIIHKMGEYVVFFADCRGAKVFKHAPPGQDPKPFLTSNQWRDLYNVTAPGGPLTECKMMIFCTQVPIIFLGKKVTEMIAPKLDDFEGMWSYKGHEAEQVEMLNMLHAWTYQQPGRNIVLCGGDVHLGGLAELSRHGRFWARQMTTGPISNGCIGGAVLGTTNLMRNNGSRMPDGWKFKNKPFHGHRNFGIVRVWPNMAGAPEANLSLVAAKGHSVRERFWNAEEGVDREVWPRWEAPHNSPNFRPH